MEGRGGKRELSIRRRLERNGRKKEPGKNIGTGRGIPHRDVCCR